MTPIQQIDYFVAKRTTHIGGHVTETMIPLAEALNGPTEAERAAISAYRDCQQAERAQQAAERAAAVQQAAANRDCQAERAQQARARWLATFEGRIWLTAQQKYRNMMRTAFGDDRELSNEELKRRLGSHEHIAPAVEHEVLRLNPKQNTYTLCEVSNA